mmetsp:Transcript_42430/g.59436  ORF Transcript_42430/g.59436 Transcript_42430/m.59436 type:complete len:82 (+) Transcript_42430:401-646(+)
MGRSDGALELSSLLDNEAKSSERRSTLIGEEDFVAGAGGEVDEDDEDDKDDEDNDDEGDEDEDEGDGEDGERADDFNKALC